MKAVIMAGGKGTRLNAVTGNKIPKPMAGLNGKPILEHQIDTLKENGIYDIIIIGGYLFSYIQEYFGDGRNKGVSLSYIEEKEPLGTAGALYYLRGRVKEDFLLVYGDVLFDMDIGRFYWFHQNKKAQVSLVVHPNSHPYDSDLLMVDKKDCVCGFIPKNACRDSYYHNIVNAGIYMISPEVLSYFEYPKKLDLEKDVLFNCLLGKGKLYAYRTPEYIKDVGTPDRLSDAEQSLCNGIVHSKNLKYSQPCIFLDRDGTLNRYKGLLSNIEQLELEQYVVEAIKEINKSKYLAIVITNQPVVARGLCTIDDVEQIHIKLESLLGRQGAYLDALYYCPHHPDKGFPGEDARYKIQCRCRKPEIGLIEESERNFHIDRQNSWMVGDTTMDIQTGINAGLGTILLQTGEAGQDGKYPVEPQYRCSNLLEAVRTILGKGDNVL